MEKESNTELIGQIDISNLDSKIEAAVGGHGWKQRGTEVYCTTCPLTHGFYIQPGLMLVGIKEDGMPEFEKVKH